MAKKRSWLYLLKRFFISDTEPKQDKKDKRSKWILFGRANIKSKPASIALPSPPRERNAGVTEVDEQQKKQALSVALASAAAAEAAVAAAHVAAHVVWLASVPQSSNRCEKDGEEDSDIKIRADAQQSNCLCPREIQEHAAIRIQTAFRGFLARKALRALKGIVTLQAIIRGRNVRRQAMNTLKCLQSIVNIHSQVCARRTQVAGRTWCPNENKQLQSLRDKIIKMDINSQKRWNGSILTNEEADASLLSKKEAATKRERVKEYALNHRNSAETDRNKVNGRWKYWLDQWVDTQASKSKELEDLDSVLTSNPKPRVEYRGKQLNGKGFQRQYYNQGVDSPVSAPRRAFHRKQCSLGEDNSFSASPLVPTYMAATESAKAKARSMSSPRLRPGCYDTYSESYSPCKSKVNLFSSGATVVSSNVRYGKLNSCQQRSPSLKGVAGPIKSTPTLKDLSFDSECSFRTWHQETTFR